MIIDLLRQEHRNIEKVASPAVCGRKRPRRIWNLRASLRVNGGTCGERNSERRDQHRFVHGSFRLCFCSFGGCTELAQNAR